MAQDTKLATMGMMSASLSHEVKSPLYVLKSRAEMFLTKEATTGDDHADVKKLCDSVIRQSDRILGIVKQFSNFAREGMKKQGELTAVSLNDVIESVRPFVDHELIQSGTQLKIHLPEDTPKVKANARVLEEVFQNLIVNACQAMAMKVDQPLITIEVEVLPHTVKVILMDNGPGLTEEQIGKVFEPFNTSEPQGMGLGLFISKELMNQMGAKIELQSKLGRGAHFVLTLPRIPS